MIEVIILKLQSRKFIKLFIALILVTIIIYLFLGNIRALVVPLVALPVSLISTFLAIYVFDFSINLFTLMALVLAMNCCRRCNCNARKHCKKNRIR